MTDEETLLDLAPKAVIEALRMNPDRYAVIIYNSKYDNNNDNIIGSSASTTAAAISSSPSLILPKYIKTTITMNTTKGF
ncbi:MAG TPA: hypothetical protein VFJ51_10385 [Nitrososphaeraceae archaeon]|nr:hypothetical protein [Nitrososphaeraceae archaeon]